jgi:hypothetical protein
LICYAISLALCGFVLIFVLRAILPAQPNYKMQTYKIIENKNGERAIFIPSTREIIPCDMAGLMAGADQWLTEIRLECRECGDERPIREMLGHGQWCGCCAINYVDAEDFIATA